MSVIFGSLLAGLLIVLASIFLRNATLEADKTEKKGANADQGSPRKPLNLVTFRGLTLLTFLLSVAVNRLSSFFKGGK